jgi:predicted CopG family antitoxin
LGTRNISISEEAYSRLAARKKPHESFTDVINRLTEKKSILELAGTLSISESREFKAHLSDLRKKSSKRMGTTIKRM